MRRLLSVLVGLGTLLSLSVAQAVEDQEVVDLMKCRQALYDSDDRAGKGGDYIKNTFSGGKRGRLLFKSSGRVFFDDNEMISKDCQKNQAKDILREGVFERFQTFLKKVPGFSEPYEAGLDLREKVRKYERVYGHCRKFKKAFSHDEAWKTFSMKWGRVSIFSKKFPPPGFQPLEEPANPEATKRAVDRFMERFRDLRRGVSDEI